MILGLSCYAQAASPEMAPAQVCKALENSALQGAALTPGSEFQLADCARRARRFASAWKLFSRVAAHPASPAPLVQAARAAAAGARSRVSELRFRAVTSVAAPLELQVDGVRTALGRALLLDAGPHAVTVSAADHETRTYMVQLREADVFVLPVEAGKPLSSRTTWGWVAAGVGLTGVTVGAVAGFSALEFKGKAEDRCSPTLKVCDPVGDYATRAGRAHRFVSNVGWIVGGLGLGTAFVLLTGDDSTPAAPRLSARLGAGQAELAGSW